MIILKKLSIEKFVQLFDPFQCKIWVKLKSPLTREEILSATPVSPETPQKMDMIWNIESREIHAGRILWLMQNWQDGHPIQVDFGMPDSGFPTSELISDGNHRLMAAIMLNKKSIDAECSGAVSEIEKYLEK